MKPDPFFPSTKGLSVYNALDRAGRDLSATEALEFLRACGCTEVTEKYVSDGIAYLLGAPKGPFVAVSGERIVPKGIRDPRGRCRPLKRVNNDRDLDWA